MKKIHSVDSRIRTACRRARLSAWRSIIRLNDAKCRNVAQMLPTRYEPVHTIVGHDESDVRVVRVAKRHEHSRHDFRLPFGGAEHYNQADVSAIVRKTLDTTLQRDLG